MKSLIAVIVAGTFAASVYALPIYEPFADATGSGGTSYTVGATLAGQTNAAGRWWGYAGSGAVTPTIEAGNLSVSGLYAGASGNSIKLVPGTGPSARLSLGETFLQANSSLYYSFAFKVPDIGGLSTSGAFFAGFNNTAPASTTVTPSVVGARVNLRRVVDGGGTTLGFNIGLSKSSGSASGWVWAPGLYTANQQIFVVGSYDFGLIGANTTDDSTRLWIDPSSSDFGNVSAPAYNLINNLGNDLTQNTTNAPILSFVFMERTAGNQPNSLIADELRIGTSWAEVTPEPSSAALVGLGVGALVAWRRARRR